MKRIVCVLSCVVLATSFSIAQSEEKEKKDGKKAVKAAALADPSLTALAQSEAPQVNLEASKEGGVVAAKVGFAPKGWLTSVVVKAPIEKSQTEVDLANLDGLTGGTSASLSLTKEFHWAQDGKANQAGSLTKTRRIRACEDYNSDLLKQIEKDRHGWSKIDVAKDQCTYESLSKKGPYWLRQAATSYGDALAATCAEYNLMEKQKDKHFDILHYKLPDDIQFGAALQDETDALLARTCSEKNLKARGGNWHKVFTEKLATSLKPVCELYNKPPFAELINLQTGECSYSNLKAKGPHWALRGLRSTAAKPWFFTLQASVAQSDFKYVDPATNFESKTQSENSRSVAAAVGNFRSGVYYSLSYRNEKLYKAASAVELCQPVPGTSALSCSQTALEGPSVGDRDILGFDVKSFVIPRIAGNLRMLYDLEGSEWNPHLVFYFIPDQATGLNAAVDMAYSTVDNKFTTRVFVGAAFKPRP